MLGLGAGLLVEVVAGLGGPVGPTVDGLSVSVMTTVGLAVVFPVVAVVGLGLDVVLLVVVVVVVVVVVGLGAGGAGEGGAGGNTGEGGGEAMKSSRADLDQILRVFVITCVGLGVEGAARSLVETSYVLANHTAALF